MWTESQTDGQTDMTKLIVAFRSFAKAPEIESLFKNAYAWAPLKENLGKPSYNKNRTLVT
jgi:hypothetical protein